MPRPAVHPGEILIDELTELGVTPCERSEAIQGSEGSGGGPWIASSLALLAMARP